MTITSDSNGNIAMFNGGRADSYHVFDNGKYCGTLDKVMMENFVNGTYWQREFVFIYQVRTAENFPNQWFRADGTPMRSGDVPKAYIAMATLVS